jgi:glycosyltransferase involved in cell wall biosynthesis
VSEALRVVHLLKGLGRGGAERLVVDHVTFGDRSAFAYEVAYLLPAKDALVEDIRRTGSPVHCLHAIFEHDLRWAVRLRRLVRDREIDILHVHSPFVAGVGRLALRRLRRKPHVVYTLHNRSDSHRKRTRMIDRSTVGFDALDIAVSANVRASLPRGLRSRFEVLHHGVDLTALRAMMGERGATRAELGLGADEVVVSTIANLRATKDHRTLLQAAARVVERAPHARFLIVGQGPLEHEIRRLHQVLGLGERVRLLGMRDDVPRVLAASDVFTLSSRFEGLPVALMEALALELPVVATDVGGIPELVTDGVEGLLVPPRRPDLLADALIAVIEDPVRRAAMGDAARGRAASLDLRQGVATIEGWYRSLGAPGD